MYGSVVRRARAERGLTQRQLAEISGIEQSNISAIENGRRAPSAETLHRLLMACGFELVAVAGGRELACPPPGIEGLDEEADAAAAPGDIGGTNGDLPMPTRVRMLTAALAVSEAIVRSR